MPGRGAAEGGAGSTAGGGLGFALAASACAFRGMGGAGAALGAVIAAAPSTSTGGAGGNATWLRPRCRLALTTAGLSQAQALNATTGASSQNATLPSGRFRAAGRLGAASSHRAARSSPSCCALW